MEKYIVKIGEGLSELPKIDYRSLKAFQGDFKELREAEFIKLRLNLFGDGEIPQNDFFVPLMVWFEPKSKTPYILDGHQRVNVLTACNATPYELPYIEIKAKNKIEAKKKLALINSQYGKITREGFDSFMFDVDADWVKGFTTLEAFTLPPLEGFVQNEELQKEIAPREEIDYSMLDDYQENDNQSNVTEFTLIVNCESSAELEDLYSRLTGEGYNCRTINKG